jgi:hypothetical protein
MVAAAVMAPSTAAGAPTYQYVGRTLFVDGRPVTAALAPSTSLRYTTILPDHHAKKKFECVFNNYQTYASIVRPLRVASTSRSVWWRHRSNAVAAVRRPE